MDWQTQIPEIQDLLKHYKAKRSQAKSSYKKYKRERQKHCFLDIITKPKELQGKEGKIEDTKLENSIKNLFNAIGIKSINPPTNNDFDVKSTFKDVKLGIEVKNGNFPTENEMFQAHKYAMRTNREFHPLIIWNNAKTNQEFDLNRIKDAEINGYGIMTTKQLYKGYLKLKSGNIDFQTFLNQIQKIGLIKFSSKSLGKSINSDVVR